MANNLKIGKQKEKKERVYDTGTFMNRAVMLGCGCWLYLPLAPHHPVFPEQEKKTTIKYQAKFISHIQFLFKFTL
jgi:hypothetical protein